MLEGAVARLLNQVLGKYVVDLDLENLNVGIFSGKVQLTDLKLNPEALFELDLPIQVKVGTIGKIELQIPWSSLWNSPTIINIEDVHIIATPIISNKQPFDSAVNKRLIRAKKRKVLSDLDTEGNFIGGPDFFSEALVASVINNLQISISNVHIRYEDSVSNFGKNIAAGMCIGNITAESTNSKWKPSKDNNSDTSFYLVKIEAVSTYWNCDTEYKEWDMPSQYYPWRNAMSASLQNFSMNEEQFDFLLKPMTAKMKITMKKTKNQVDKLLSELVIHDCNIHISKTQYESILTVIDALNRMLIKKNFVSILPNVEVKENSKIWWKYAYSAVLEQRVRPYTWQRIKKTRTFYRNYLDTYKQIILNPNDTELKLDLQQHEDNLDIVNIVIARQQARLLLKSRSIGEKSFWSMLPSPEKLLLCEKIGYSEKFKEIDRKYLFQIGNINVSLLNDSKEILVLTLTQAGLTLKPNNKDASFNVSFKVEGFIVEGATNEDTLVPIISSEHLCNSPAYFFKAEFEKMPIGSKSSHKLNVALDSVECVYHKESLNEIEKFFETTYFSKTTLENHLPVVISEMEKYVNRKLLETWELNLNLKIPFFVIPDTGSILRADNILVLDFGRYFVTTEICEHTEIEEHAKQMELEEQLYSKLHIECSDIQVLFCDSSDNWRDARKENDTDLHILPRTSFTSIYAYCVNNLQTIPSFKFNINIQCLKINASERQVGLFLKYFNRIPSINVKDNHFISDDPVFLHDFVEYNASFKYLLEVQSKVSIDDGFGKTKRGKFEKIGKKLLNGERQHLNDKTQRKNMNEAYARIVDLPGLEDNISPTNNIRIMYRFVINELLVVYSKSSDSTDRQYLNLRVGVLAIDMALMTYGPAYQLTVNSILLTDKMHNTSSGQYLDLVYSPLPSTTDVVTVLYRKVSASCPDFWTHFHGVETSLVTDFGTIYVLLHQEAIHTFIKYSKYMKTKLKAQVPQNLMDLSYTYFNSIRNKLNKKSETPVPPGSVKFSHSARLMDLDIRVCDSDFDIVNIQLSGLEVDFLFRANERFVFRSFLSNIEVEHLSEVTLYSKVFSTDKDKVFEVKYVRHASVLKNDISPNKEDNLSNGCFKFQLGQIHITFLYKLFVQLQRFIINLEALPTILKCYSYLKQVANTATNTLKSNPRINLVINMCGPIFLFPQKSSSPNVIIIDTGSFHVENLFKENPTEFIENIMIKWQKITLSRGVMTMAQTLEMQESLIDPIQINMDIKRSTSLKTFQKLWDIDGLIENIEINLGQKDLAVILLIYNDNITEGKIIDIFPNPLKSPDVAEQDEIVKSLEAFFCEPKQKNILIKFVIENVKVMFFFDSGELLSSPIRDMSHGLCLIDIVDINASMVIYTDKTGDGKMSVDQVLVEEIGPDANSLMKRILYSPIDENKNNNCHITINKPPIFDITFHQTKNGDISIDFIVGRLSLNLSIPFCEKLAVFILECLPKDNFETGCINFGYEGETQVAQNNLYQKSLTISFRINKPEFTFLVQSTSNKSRYFITKAEILADYSRHGHRLNFVLSLSGLHNLFYDSSQTHLNPYVILRPCDIEFSHSFSLEKGTKASISISSFYIQICSEVVHSLNDILNDIAEHFKLPVEAEVARRKSSQIREMEEIWEPKKMRDYIAVAGTDSQNEFNVELKTNHEVFIIPKFEVVVIFELEQMQVLLFKLTMEVTVYDWSTLLNSTSDISIQGNYFSEQTQKWEPLIDPVMIGEQEYKPWEVNLKVFQDKGLPMVHVPNGDKTKIKTGKEKTRKTRHSYTTTEDEDSGEDMMYLEPNNSIHSRGNRRVKTSLSTFLDDSDSENEDCAMEKLAAAISDLFTGDWNESEDSDCAHSSEGEADSDENYKKQEQTPPQNFNFPKSTYILLDSKETLNLTITPSFLKLLNELLTIYSSKTLSITGNSKSISLTNDIGPNSKVELFEKGHNDQDDVLIMVKTYENQESCPNSPTKNTMENNMDENNDKEKMDEESFKLDAEINYDHKTINSLQFPVETTAELFEKVNHNYARIQVADFAPMQTNCSNSNWSKMLKLRSKDSKQIYYLGAKHTVNKNGRKLAVSSPLQIKNETCFPLSVLYQPSVLQQLNLEPIGEIINPFETTMRIAVLDAYESYNVPLYVAYYCKLFIQPAYAEGNYVCNSGIWWSDLTNELDTAHNFICTPKSNSNVDSFSLRVVLKKNFDSKTSQVKNIPNYVIYLLPPLVVQNYLPFSLEIESLATKLIKIEAGEKCSVYTLDLTKDQKLQVKMKQNMNTWTGVLNLTTHLDDKIVILSSDSNEKSIAINAKLEKGGSCSLYFYASYWIVNKTTLPLKIKASASNSLHESTTDEILLFTYKRHGKQTLNVQVYDSNWSNEFGLECAETTGLIVCKDSERKKKYLFFMNAALSELCPRLTKIITILPSFVVQNQTNKSLRIMEHNEKTDLWLDVLPFKSVVFWPETSSMQMYLKYRDSKIISQAFNISTCHKTVLRMDKGGAITITVTGGVSDSFKIIFTEYKHGDAPVLIKNYCADLFLKIQQQDQSPVTLLNPYNSLIYTWDDPCRPRLLVWNIYNNKESGYPVDIFTDGFGEEKIKFRTITPTTNQSISSSEESDSSDSVQPNDIRKVRRDKVTIYWACFRNGVQRTLLFTQELRIYNDILTSNFLTPCEIDALISLNGIGLSIFTNDSSNKEHLYASLADMPAIWEVNVGHKWKTLTLELASWIEEKYKLQTKKCQLKDYIHIDFEKMFMLKPFFAELRRTYVPAMYAHFRKTKRDQYFNLKLHSLQIDNKATNTIVLRQLPYCENTKGKPFLDFAFSRMPLKNISVYKYVRLTVLNFAANVENDLIYDLGQLIYENKKFFGDSTAPLVNDMNKIHSSITKMKEDLSEKSIIENVFVSGFGIQLNICNRAHIGVNKRNIHFSKILNLLFPINISPYMPLEGVYHKISSVEQIHIYCDLTEAIVDTANQIQMQFLQQYYSHVLGLQVLVNTFAIQPSTPMPNLCEPEKMANILLNGSRCLLGHINMSPTALEQSILDLFTNQSHENILRIGRHGSYHNTEEIIPKCVTASCKNFNIGVPNALSQLIVKNHLNGISNEGEMFFRTTGKALLSLMTRHPDEKSDSVEIARDALRRASILGEPIKMHLRLTRYRNKHLGLKPMSVYESIGHHLLETIANGQFANDTYWAHSTVDKIGKSILVVSLEHVIRINKCRIWGPWEIEWSMDLDDIISMPKMVSSELIFNKRPGEVNSEETLKILGDKEMLMWIHAKIEQAIIVSMEEKSWTLTVDP